MPPLPASTSAARAALGMDLLAATVADLAVPLESRTRALALRRFLLEEKPTVLPPRLRGVTAPYWDRVRADGLVPEWSVASRATSADGTVKLVLRLADASVETVVIPGTDRTTICVSSQAGCTRRCAFCATARLGAGRNLRAGEIVLQYLAGAAVLPGPMPRNVVFMGMGEPLDNADAVLAAVRSLTDVLPGLSARHVTVSTAGVLPGMRRFLLESDANLALSLNATTDDVRTRLMPHNARWPIAALLALLREETARRPGRRFFLEYVLLGGVNDSPDDAQRLAGLLQGIAAQVNVIPHNAFPGSPYAAPSQKATLRFQERLTEHRVKSVVRWPRGSDVAGACGQLALLGSPARTPTASGPTA